jgi:hypothetical protein
MKMDYTIYYIAIPIIVIVAIIGWILYKRIGTKVKDPYIRLTTMDPGWQFFPNPTTGEKPGTIFRITPSNQRFRVAETDVPIHDSTVATGKKTQKIDVSTGMLVKIAGINLDVGLKGGQKQELVFEMDDCKNQITSDEEIIEPIRRKLASIPLIESDRYFVIRETNAAKHLVLKLRNDLVESLGGKANIQSKIEANSTVLSKNEQLYYDLDRTFPDYMRVMFNAEELKPVVKPKTETTSRAPGARAPQLPEFVRVPITQRLSFTDA